MITRGFRNNNPANIRRSSAKWLGLKKLQQDSRFCQFESMKYGIRAFFILMRTYRYKYGLKTPEQILKRFAPSSENDLSSYLYFIESKGIPKNVEFTSDVIYCVFAKWIFRYESQYVVSCSYLKDLMDELNCYVINEKKECKESDLFSDV